MTPEALGAIAARDLISNGPRNHFGLCGIRTEDREQCQICAADDAAGDDRTTLLAYVDALRGELSQCQKERTDFEVAAGKLLTAVEYAIKQIDSGHDAKWARKTLAEALA